MPGYKEHKIVGGLTGGTASLFSAQTQPPLLACAEVFGGVLAGQYAGTLADKFEPGTSSHHRDFFHALAPSAYGATLAIQQIGSVQTSLRYQAQSCFQMAASTNDGIQQFVGVTAGLLLHVLAGAVPAIPVGYLSHVALDSASPRGVPVFVRGF
jgi:hypothetical protein